MRLRIYCQIVLWLSLAASAYAADGMVPLLTPCGGTEIGTLQDIDSIALCRAGSTTPYKTNPEAITGYVRGRLAGELAPAFHNHSTATATRDGYQSAADKRQIDASTPNSRAEGATADGVWRSIRSKGYVASAAQSRWPYLTTTGTLTGPHLIQTDADGDLYGMDWVAARHAVNKGVATGIMATVLTAGTHIFERNLLLPSGMELFGPGTIAPREGVLATDTPLITTADNSSGSKIIGVRFWESQKTPVTAGQYTAIRVGPGSWRVTIADCLADNMQHIVQVMPNSSALTIRNNRTYRVAQAVELAGSTGSHDHLTIDGNDFAWGYREGMDEAVQTVGNVGISGLKLTNNRVTYARLFYHQNLLGGDQFVDISNNIVLGNTNDSSYQPLIHFVSASAAGSGWDNKISNNILWAPGMGAISIGGQGQIIINGNTAGHSPSADKPFLRVNAHIKNLSFTANQSIAYEGTSPSFGYIGFAGLLPSNSTSTNITLSGNYRSPGLTTINDPAIYSVAGGVTINGDDNDRVETLLASAYTVPATAEVITSSSGNAGPYSYPITLPNAASFYPGKRYTLVNAHATNTVNVYLTGTSKQLNGTIATNVTLTLQPLSSVEFVSVKRQYDSIWMQTR